MSITEVAVNGTPLDLANVEWSIAIDHGRNDITQAPQASTAELTLYGFTGIPVEISDLLEITAYTTYPRFTGLVTDVTLTHDKSWPDGTVPRLKITAMGNLARLGLLEVGNAGYPEETLDDRVTSILDDTGITYQANVEPYMVLLAEDPDQNRSAMDWLSGICLDVGATMCDLPDGNILFESYTRRGIGYNPATWAGVTDPWSSVTYVWSDVYESVTAAPAPVVLDPDGVIWEPVWTNSVLSVVNSATVTYGDPEATITASDVPSQAVHGVRAFAWKSRLADGTDAYDRVNHIIVCQAEPRYAMQSVQILVSELGAVDQDLVLDLIQGSRVIVQNLPQPAPLTQYLGVVEGWSESYTPDGHILTLSLSDPRYSYAMATWGDIDPALLWSGVSASIQWYNVVLPSDLAA